MLFLSSTTPADNKISKDKTIRYSLISIWMILIIFGIVSMIKPVWLQKASDPGRKSEALINKNYGDGFLKQKKYQMAIVQYKRALQIDPDLESALGNLAITYTQMKLYDKAIALFNRTIKKNPKHKHTIYFNIGELYKKKDDLESAVKYYHKCAENAPFPSYAYRNIGKIYLENNKWDLAIESFQKALDNKFDLHNSYIGMLKRDQIIYSETAEITQKITSLLLENENPARYDKKILTGWSVKIRKLPKHIFSWEKLLE